MSNQQEKKPATLREQQLWLYQNKEFALALSITSCTAITAFACAKMPMSQIVVFFVAPYALHRLALAGAKRLDTDFGEQTKVALGDGLGSSFFTKITKILNPTWSFFVILTPHVTTSLTPLLAPYAPYLWDHAARRISIILTCGIMYTVFIENADYTTRKCFGGGVEARKSLATIWQHDALFSGLIYTTIQAVQGPTPSLHWMFLASTAARFLRTMLSQRLDAAEEHSINPRISDALFKGITFGAIYTTSSYIRMELMVWLDMHLMNTCFATACAQCSITVPVLASFLSSWAYTIIRDVAELTCKSLIWDDKTPLNSYYNSLVKAVDSEFVKIDLGRSWSEDAVSI